MDGDIDTSVFRYVKTKEELRDQQRQRQKERAQMEQTQSKQSEKVQRGNIWEFLSQTQQEVEEIQETKNLEIQKAVDEMDANIYIECATKLSKRATQLAARVYLEVDLVVAMVFVSAQCAGAKWISLWDIFR